MLPLARVGKCLDNDHHVHRPLLRVACQLQTACPVGRGDRILRLLQGLQGQWRLLSGLVPAASSAARHLSALSGLRAPAASSARHLSA